MTIGGYYHHYHTWPATTTCYHQAQERAHIRQSCFEEQQYDNNIIDAAKISGGSQTPTIMPITHSNNIMNLPLYTTLVPRECVSRPWV